MNYLVFQIGCLECFEAQSKIIGLYEDFESAVQAADRAWSEHILWASYSVRIYDLKTFNEIKWQGYSHGRPVANAFGPVY